MKPYYSHEGITICHGDCREVLPTLADESIDTIWTDPPYGHANQDGDLASARVGVLGGRQAPPKVIANDRPEEYEDLMKVFLQEASRILKSDCCCCCCCTGGGGPDPSFAKMALWIDQYLSFFHAVVWDKSERGWGLGWRYRRNYEFVMVAHRKGGKLSWFSPEAVPNILRVPPVPNKFHPTTKPVELVKSFLQWHTNKDSIILDPFMGTGTTLRAAKDLGRRAIGIEIEERYCEIAAKRLQQEVLLREA